MKIEKNLYEVGMWTASWNSPKGYICEVSTDKLKALKKLFARLEWVELGNWNRNA